MLAEARSQHYALARRTQAVAGGGQSAPAMTLLTAPWQPVGLRRK
jgi:hypothetical protein